MFVGLDIDWSDLNKGAFHFRTVTLERSSCLIPVRGGIRLSLGVNVLFGVHVGRH